jgi:hypothetical protein
LGKEPTEVPFGVVLTVNGGDGSETRQRVADSVDRPLFESFAAMEWLAMMGRLNHDQRQLFYSFRLEDAVPDDHLVRAIAGVLDLSWVHAELAPYYPKLGRPSIDPVLMIRMLAFAKLYARDGRPSVASCGRCRLLDTRSHDDHWTKRRHPETAHDTVSSHDCTVR